MNRRLMMLMCDKTAAAIITVGIQKRTRAMAKPSQAA
jgi:hypothetical protein